MPLAVTHILVPIILVDIFRDHILKNTKALTNKHVLLAGLAGLFPDIDIPIGHIFLNANVHRLYTHNIWIPVLFLAFALYFDSIKKRKICLYFIMMAFGFSTHLLLDGVLSGTIRPFFPVSTYVWGWDLFGKFFGTFYPRLANPDFGALIFSGLDAVLLFLWLIHEEMGHKIKDYF